MLLMVGQRGEVGTTAGVGKDKSETQTLLCANTGLTWPLKISPSTPTTALLLWLPAPSKCSYLYGAKMEMSSKNKWRKRGQVPAVARRFLHILAAGRWISCLRNGHRRTAENLGQRWGQGEEGSQSLRDTPAAPSAQRQASACFTPVSVTPSSSPPEPDHPLPPWASHMQL